MAPWCGKNPRDKKGDKVPWMPQTFHPFMICCQSHRIHGAGIYANIKGVY